MKKAAREGKPVFPTLSLRHSEAFHRYVRREINTHSKCGKVPCCAPSPQPSGRKGKAISLYWKLSGLNRKAEKRASWDGERQRLSGSFHSRLQGLSRPMMDYCHLAVWGLMIWGSEGRIPEGKVTDRVHSARPVAF